MADYYGQFRGYRVVEDERKDLILYREPLPRSWFIVRYLPRALPQWWLYHQDIGTHVTRGGLKTRFFY